MQKLEHQKIRTPRNRWDPPEVSGPVITLEFDHLPPALNMNTNHHWGQRAAHVKKSHAAVRTAAEAQGVQLPMQPLGAVWLHAHFYLPNLNSRDLEQLRDNAKNYVDYLCVPLFWKSGERAGEIRRDGLSIIEDDRMTVVQYQSQSWELRRNSPGFTLDILQIAQ